MRSIVYSEWLKQYLAKKKAREEARYEPYQYDVTLNKVRQLSENAVNRIKDIIYA